MTANSASISVARDKERTLRIAWMLSAWAPLAGVIALSLGPSTILIADTLRRSSDLIVLVLSWLVFRRMAQGHRENTAYWTLMERRLSVLVAGALFLSMAMILLSGTLRLAQGAQVGWILPGLLIALAGGGVNGWLWRRNRRLYRCAPSPLSDAQWRFYRSKTLVDSCVVLTLLIGAMARGTPVGPIVDFGGSLIIAAVLLRAARHVMQDSAGGVRGLWQGRASSGGIAAGERSIG